MASRGHPPSPGCCFGMDRGPAGVRGKKAPVQHRLITPNTAASTWRLHRTPLSLWAIFETLVTQSQLHTKHNNLIKFMLNWLVCSILITFTVMESVRLLQAWVMMLFNSNILSSSWKAALIPQHLLTYHGQIWLKPESQQKHRAADHRYWSSQAWFFGVISFTNKLKTANF